MNSGVKHHPHRIPVWAKPKVRNLGAPHDMKARLRRLSLHTVCESARCPNIGECFVKGTATVMIMGDVCTRKCAFCAVTHGAPSGLDPSEPRNVADLVGELGLRHIVITSVARDDLPDGGAEHFLACVRAVKEAHPSTKVEILTPDFQGDVKSAALVAEAPFDIFNHNMENGQTTPETHPAYGEIRALARRAPVHGGTASRRVGEKRLHARSW
ncbi:MAG: lipoyl synthase [Deltaproteobacteria bacterium]|nr:lipoyl synthase [Deltaproteobacteria bacterium]